jgi:hypothetical protein
MEEHMNYNIEKNNKVYIVGEIVSEAVFSHEVYGEGFYELFVKVMRLSGQADVLPVTISERLITSGALKIGSQICALGQFRSYNKLEDGKSKLMLTVFVRELIEKNDWNSLVEFSWLKTCPYFWIPAHTIVFLLPGQYRVLVSAFLSIALGLLLAIAKKGKQVQAGTAAKA